MLWEKRFEEKMCEIGSTDPAHSLSHFRRVVALAKKLGEESGAEMQVLIPAAWLHDIVNLPKNHPERALASRHSAREAVAFLSREGYPEEFMDRIAHAIEAHSFSAGIEPRSLEARIVQDADRLDGVGAIGVARCFSVGTQLGGDLYDSEDPFFEGRELDDRRFMLDHFFVKLFKICTTLKTPAARREGLRRFRYMKGFVEQLSFEVGKPLSNRALELLAGWERELESA